MSSQEPNKRAKVDVTEEVPIKKHPVLQTRKFLRGIRYREGLKIDFEGDVPMLWNAVEIPFANCAQRDDEDDIRSSRIQVKLSDGGEMLYNKGKFSIDRFKELAKPSAFGHGTETKLDPEVRSCLEIPGDRVDVGGLPDFDNLLAPLMLISERGVDLHLHKMLLYEEGGHFAEHVDSLHRPGHIASLLVSLPTDGGFKGGVLQVRCGDSKPFVWNASSYSVDAVIFFTDCPHQVTTVTKGRRLILQFDVCVDRDFEPVADDPNVSELVKNLSERQLKMPCVNSSSITMQTTTDDEKNVDPADLKLLQRFKDDSGRIQQIIAKWKEQLAEDKQKQLGIMLKHKYAKADVVPTMLKGADLKLYKDLQNEPTLRVRLCSLIVYTSRYTEEDCYEDAVISTFVWDPENNKVDQKQAVLSVPLFPSGIQWSHTEGGGYTGNESAPEENHYLAAALFVELVDRPVNEEAKRTRLSNGDEEDYEDEEEEDEDDEEDEEDED